MTALDYPLPFTADVLYGRPLSKLNSNLRKLDNILPYSGGYKKELTGSR